VLSKSSQVRLVATGEQHAIHLHVLRAQAHLPRLGRDLQVLEGIQGALQEIRELEQTAGGVDQLAVRLEEWDRLERRRQRAETPVCGQLSLACVYGQLRAECDRADTVAPRDEVALHLHVAQNFVERAIVAGE
jgi:hypothetical protein